jgi:hypothetical protein
MKWIIRIAALLAIVIAALLWFGYSQLGVVIKYAIEKGGPAALKAPVKVQKVGLSFTGSGSIEGLELGNPEGFTSPKSLRIGKAELSVNMSTVKDDKILIQHIHLLEPEVHLEAGAGGTNLGVITKNARSAATSLPGGGSAPAAAPGAATDSPGEGQSKVKLQVDEVLVTGAKLTASAGLLPGVNASATLPDIKISGLGTGPEGITPAALTAEILARLAEEAAKAGAGGSLKDLLKGGDIKVDADGLKKGIEDLGKLLK